MVILSAIMSIPGPCGVSIAEFLKKEYNGIPVAFQSVCFQDYEYLKRKGVELFDKIPNGKIIIKGEDYIGNKDVVEYVREVLR